MPSSVYDIGDVVILHAETRLQGVLVSCNGVFSVKRPKQPTPVAVIANESPTGIFEGSYPIERSGRHFYRFIASGLQSGQEEYWFDVREANA